MTLKSSRIGDAVLRYNDSELHISAPISKMKIVQDRYGKPFRQVLLGSGLDEVIMCDLLETLQVGTEYTADEIGDWLFGNLEAVNSPEMKVMFERAFSILMGVPYDEPLAKAAKAQKKASPASTK